jgi:hypothetical protein
MVFGSLLVVKKTSDFGFRILNGAKIEPGGSRPNMFCFVLLCVDVD